MANSVNINKTDNDVSIINTNQQIIVSDDSKQTLVNVTQPVTAIVQVNTPGPRGEKGDPGESIDINSLVTTSSFNAFTSSYYIDSASVNDKINSLTGATSSYVLNSQTSSFTTTASFNAFTSSYNTGSFTGSFFGSFFGTSSWAFSSSQAVTASYVTGSTFGSTNPATSASYALTASFALNAGGGGGSNFIATGSVTASVDITSNLFLIRSSSNTIFSVSNTGQTTISGSASNLFLIRNVSNTPVLIVSQSGVVAFSTQSVQLTGDAPYGGIYFTSDALYIGID